MGMKVKIRIVGRPKGTSSSSWIEEGFSMYQKRLRSSNIEVETDWHKDDGSLLKGIRSDSSYDSCMNPTSSSSSSSSPSNNTKRKRKMGKTKGGGSSASSSSSIVLLDPTYGKLHGSSEEFATDFYNWLQKGGSRLVFVIGGADGLPPELLNDAQRNTTTFSWLSLSPLTFTHQFARLLLIEQIYRASEIRKGSNYHK